LVLQVRGATAFGHDAKIVAQQDSDSLASLQSLRLVQGRAFDLPFAGQANPLIEIVGHFLGLGRYGLGAPCEFIGNRRDTGLRRRHGRLLVSDDGGKSHGGSFLVSKCRNRHDFVQ
jgi:hypothetical protein